MSTPLSSAAGLPGCFCCDAQGQWGGHVARDHSTMRPWGFPLSSLPSRTFPPGGQSEIRGDFSCRKENQGADPKEGDQVQAWVPTALGCTSLLGHPGCSIGSQFLFPLLFFFHVFSPSFLRLCLFCVPKWGTKSLVNDMSDATGMGSRGPHSVLLSLQAGAQ